MQLIDDVTFDKSAAIKTKKKKLKTFTPRKIEYIRLYWKHLHLTNPRLYLRLLSDFVWTGPLKQGSLRAQGERIRKLSLIRAGKKKKIKKRRKPKAVHKHIGPRHRRKRRSRTIPHKVWKIAIAARWRLNAVIREKIQKIFKRTQRNRDYSFSGTPWWKKKKKKWRLMLGSIFMTQRRGRIFALRKERRVFVWVKRKKKKKTEVLKKLRIFYEKAVTPKKKTPWLEKADFTC